jgi:hypothetical protein
VVRAGADEAALAPPRRSYDLHHGAMATRVDRDAAAAFDPHRLADDDGPA